MLESFREVLAMSEENPKKLQSIAKAAAKARFTWETVAEDYLQKLY